MRPPTPQPPRRPSRPGRGRGRASSSASERRKTPTAPRRSPAGQHSTHQRSSEEPDPASRRALVVARRERQRRRSRSRILYGTTFVVAIALIVVGLRFWGFHPGFALPLTGDTTATPSPAAAEAAAESHAASPTAAPSSTSSASPTPSASMLPAPRLDAEGFAHSDAVGDGTWTIAPAVPVSRPTAGIVYRYVLQVEGGTHVDATAAASIVESTLNDERGWPTAQNTSFEPVADPAAADFTFNIATPPTSDALCSPLDTGGMWSCRNANNVVINSDRWNWGAVPYPDVDSYRTYVTNHEVGHFLGHEHEFCAGAGLKAPLMAQQSHDIAGGCVYNTWPTQDNQPG